MNEPSPPSPPDTLPQGELEFISELCPVAAELALAAGDAVLLFSDGVSEAVESFDQEYGEERLEALWRAHGPGPRTAVLDRVFADVPRFRGAAAQNDDMTMVVVSPDA